MLTPTLLLGIACASVLMLALGCSHRLVGGWASRTRQLAESDLSQLFVFISASTLIRWSVLLAGGAVMLAALAGIPAIFLPIVGATVLAIPRLLVRALRARWRRRIATQLPDAMALWAGLLRAGQGSSQALQQVANRQASPLGDELRLVTGQLRLGVTLEAAFSGLRERSGLQDLRLLATLLSSHRELGGNLADSLQRLADLLRNRLLMESRILALTAQGRLQGVVVGILPLLLLAVLYLMEPAAMRVLHTTWQGWVALGFMALLEITGFVLIRRIVRIEV
jgi:tight adherence protein B